MKKLTVLIVVVLSLFIGAANAAGTDATTEYLSATKAGVELSTMLFTMQVRAGQVANARKTAVKSKASLDEALKKVKKLTKDKAKVFSAFKKFYVAAYDLYDVLDPTAPRGRVLQQMAKRKAALSKAGNEMMLEAKLAE